MFLCLLNNNYSPLYAQLLGQFENTGPPPAEKEKISSLPTVIVSQEQAGQSLPFINNFFFFNLFYYSFIFLFLPET